jgi:multidrug resistance protein MdtO
MVSVFIVAFISAYVVGGSPRISYAGFQIAFAFFLCVVQGAGPAFDMTIARDRAIGILIGNVVSYLIFANLWPISVGRRIDPAFAALLRNLSAMMTTKNRSARGDRAVQAQSALAAIQSDIDLVRYEPSRIRPSPDWLKLRQKDASDISSLQGPLLLSADRDPTTSAYIAGRLEALASRIDVAATEAGTTRAVSPTEWTVLPLVGIIDEKLRKLERAAGQHFPYVGA